MGTIYYIIYLCLLLRPLDGMIEWPMPFKKCNIELIVNDRVIDEYTLRGDVEKCKKFKRPTFTETETGKLGRPKFVSHLTGNSIFDPRRYNDNQI